MHIQFRNAQWHRAVNTLLLLVLIGMLSYGLIVGAKSRQNVRNIVVSVGETTKALAEVKASQDLDRQQYITYIHDMIEAMNKLQKDNANPEEVKKRGVRVPKWPVLRPVDGQLTESDLRRMPQVSLVPNPTPSVKTKIKTVIKYKKRPTPKPWYQEMFKPKSTR